jgi:D-alanyl-D-alanine carboxypeptidase (penicillin-binding protein 5/6)
MSVSKKSSKKTNKSSDPNNRRIYYAFFLLFLANIIVFSFFGYFIYKLFSNQIDVYSREQIIINSIPKLKSESEVQVSAVSFVVYDPLTRTTVLSKNPNLRLSPASSIKILTALVVLDIYNPSDYLPAVGALYDESKMGLYTGELVSVENLLYGLLLISGNDAAKTLASNFPNGTNAFVIAMNNKAKSLGLEESYFVDPSGYMDSNYSSAFQMAILGAYAMKNEKIREIVGTQNKIVYDATGLTPHYLQNLNELLVNKNVTGIKTGFTNEAGGVLLTSYVHNGRELIIVVMKSHDRFSDTQKIIDEISENVYYSEVTSADIVAN